MFLAPPSTEALALLAKQPNASIEARGSAESGASGAKAFAPGQCTYIYQTPL